MLRTIGSVDYSRERKLYEMIAGYMLANGYSRSSAWCFSRRPGMIDEYVVDQDDYLGLGSGAFSYLHGSLYASTFSIEHYLSLVESGTLRVGEDFICGHLAGRVRAMLDERGNNLEEAGPATPVQVLGVGGVPQAGDTFQVMDAVAAGEIADAKTLIGLSLAGVPVGVPGW